MGSGEWGSRASGGSGTKRPVVGLRDDFASKWTYCGRSYPTVAMPRS
jgi:hypothetical protein